jgi:hypothetical protein
MLAAALKEHSFLLKARLARWVSGRQWNACTSARALCVSLIDMQHALNALE